MTYLPPEFTWSVEASRLWAPDPNDTPLDEEEFLSGLALRDADVENQFRALRSGMQLRGGSVLIPFGGLIGTLTNQTLAEDFLGANNAYIWAFDLTSFNQVRLMARVTTASTSANTPILSVKYDTQAGGFSTTVGDYSDIGGSGVTVSLATTGAKDSGWASITQPAKAEVYLTVTQQGGDGAADPVLGQVAVMVR